MRGWDGVGITRALLFVSFLVLSMDAVLGTVSFISISVMFHMQPT